MEDDPDGDAAHVVGLDASVTEFDAFIGPDSPFIDFDAHIDFDARVDVDAPVIDHDRDLKSIVDDLLNLPPSASLGRFPTSRLARQVRAKLVDIDKLVICDVVKDDHFVRVGHKGDDL